VTYPLPRPFVVLATDNPIEYEGTYPLPEAQLDRFASWSAARRRWMVRRRLSRGSVVRQLTDAAGVIAMRESLEEVPLDPAILAYIVNLVAATREHPKVTVGASPRGTLVLVQLVRGHAVLGSRDYVIPEDVKAVAIPVLAHRLVLPPEMWVRQVTGSDVVGEILAQILPQVTVPRTGE
jgi:MoxR-like ATPase